MLYIHRRGDPWSLLIATQDAFCLVIFLSMVVGGNAGKVCCHGGLVTDWVEVLVEHRLLGCEPFLPGC